MKSGDKFKAYRKRNGQAILKTRFNPDGVTLTCKKYVDGVITCKERTGTSRGRAQPYQIFTKFFFVEAAN